MKEKNLKEAEKMLVEVVKGREELLSPWKNCRKYPDSVI